MRIREGLPLARGGVLDQKDTTATLCLIFANCLSREEEGTGLARTCSILRLMLSLWQGARRGLQKPRPALHRTLALASLLRNRDLSTNLEPLSLIPVSRREKHGQAAT